MQPFKISHRNAPLNEPAPADAILRIAVTFKGSQNVGPTKIPARLSSASISSFAPEPGEMERAIEVLRQRGFTVSGIGKMTV